MKPDTDQLLRELPDVLPPGVSLTTVAYWVKTGRTRPHFHLTAWLARVWRWTAS